MVLLFATSANVCCWHKADITAKLLSRDEARRIAANIAKLPELFAQIASGLIAITIRGPSREIRSAWGLVHGIGSARPAGSTYGGLALLPCCEPAIRGSTATAIIVGAPRIALRLSGFFNADDGGESHQDEQRKPHGYLLGKQRTTLNTVVQ